MNIERSFDIVATFDEHKVTYSYIARLSDKFGRCLPICTRRGLPSQCSVSSALRYLVCMSFDFVCVCVC